MVKSMKVNGQTISLTVRGSRFQKMGPKNTMESSSKGVNMGTENIFGEIIHATKGNGQTMCLKEKVNIFGVMAGSMLVNSVIISLMVKGNLFTKTGALIGANSKMIKNMVQAFINGQPARRQKANGLMASRKEKANSLIQKDRPDLESGKMGNANPGQTNQFISKTRILLNNLSFLCKRNDLI